MRKGIPNLSALQAFEATARLGSFTRAADELALTHSAVHRQVSSLEARLGVQLFNRVRRRIVLTDAGAEYAGRIRQHLEQIEKDTFSLMSRASLGRRLHIAVLPTLAANWLIPKLKDFQQQYPDISVSLSLRTLPFQFDDEPFDGAIYHSHAAWPGTQGSVLFAERELIPICSPDLAMKSEQNDSLQQLTHLHLNSRPDAWRDWYEHVGRAYPSEAAGGPRYEMFAMVLAAAQAGLGVGLVPRFLAQQALDRGDLIMPVCEPLPVSQSYYFGYPMRNEATAALKAFERWLRETAQESFVRL
ncbi:MAG: LysR substrate-binding domain-containing protein [Burkholderiaceae bacterium]|nr:LysR substrate-binding domain-containing protein [Burkholderiaceae bacterium]MCD8516593.1 LysR substrate-binding domain-containing protein [Burkholderiaceae bacterium]MCD8537307.1 LysR substrate-binding domain-containing protein [Burkholderiaceae bacterium]MCD8565184.1 LysR substrate-binding domain-containing protein [Burkholderiaceae bacterium]